MSKSKKRYRWLLLPILTLVLVSSLFAFLLFSTWLYQLPPDTIRHEAKTQPIEQALQQTRLLSAEMREVEDLGTRTGQDWPGFLGPNQDGKSAEVGIRPWSLGGPRIAWTLEVGESYSSPTICRGRLLMFDRLSALARCRCLNSETGQELWRYNYPSDYTDRQGWEGGPRASPVTDGSRVYLYGAEGMLHCLRLEDGQLLWKIDTVPTFGVVQNLFGVGSTPFLDGNRLLVQVGGSPVGTKDHKFTEMPANNTCIVAFDKFTGQVLYQCGNDLASYASPQVVNFANPDKPEAEQRVGLMFARGGLLAFDPTNGKVHTHFPFRASSHNSVNACNVLTQGSQLFITESYEKGCKLLEWRGGGELATIWESRPRRPEQGLCSHWGTPILVDGHIYGCQSRHTSDAELRCVEWATGKVKWRANPLIDEDISAGRSTLIYADGHLLYLAEEGVLFLIKASSEGYQQISVWDGRKTLLPGQSGKPCLEHPSWCPPVLSHGLLYLRGRGRLVCLDVIPNGE
jgi:outer membrane protein assembly factor BamB